jgi:hypothetical protein
MARPGRPPDIEAEICFLSSEDSGKSGPIHSGYRPHHDFGLDGMLNDAYHEYIGVESIPPGPPHERSSGFSHPSIRLATSIPDSSSSSKKARTSWPTAWSSTWSIRHCKQLFENPA